MKKLMNNPAGFAIFYVLCALPTYIIPWIKPGLVTLTAENSTGGSSFRSGAST